MVRPTKASIRERSQRLRLINLGLAKQIVLNTAHTGRDYLGIDFCYGLNKSWMRVKKNYPLVREAFTKNQVLQWIKEECPRCYDPNEPNEHRLLHNNIQERNNFHAYLNNSPHPILAM